MTQPVVLLHGVGLDGTVWDTVRARLPAGLQVAAPNLLGHGDRPPAPDDVRLADLAADVAARLDPGTHLVGFSLGALVAQHVARYHPDLVATLTSVSSVCRRTPGERAAVLSRLRAAETDFRASAEASLDRWYADTGTDPVLVAATRDVLLANDPRSFLGCYRVFATADADLGPQLARIGAPSLAVTGELDPGSTPEMTRRLGAAIPGCRVRIVPGARHMLPVQAPGALAQLLTAFIGGTPHDRQAL